MKPPEKGQCPVWDNLIVTDAPYARSHKLSKEDLWYLHCEECDRCKSLRKA